MLWSCVLVSVFLLRNPVSAWVTWDISITTPAVSDTTDIPVELDILKLLNVSSVTPGVSEVLGPTDNAPAYKFRPGYNNVLVPSPGSIAAALTDPTGFTLVFVYRQHRKSLGTLLSVHSPGRVTPWFQVTSNLRTGQLVLHYRVISDSKLHQNSWALQPSPSQIQKPNSIPTSDVKRGNGWTHLALVYNASSGTLTLHLDCQKPKQQPVAGTHGFHIPPDALVYFRQEPGFKKKFLGSMQVVKIKPYPVGKQDIGWSCSSAA